ncbi:MAG TPA: hypothetical protein VGF06_02905 [Terriglobales bacterium]|jgi:outer membrane protein assembly factor BamD (BamD/ComL family)
MKATLWLLAVTMLPPVLAQAQSSYVHAATVRTAPIYISPESSSAKLGEVGRGREVIILEKTPGWLHVQANVAAKLMEDPRIVSGWILDKGIVLPTTPNADKIIYGEAVDSEDEASRRHGRRGADLDALRLYYRVYDMFPQSPLAGQSLYRAADIKWQLDKIDVMSKPSAREQDPFLRGEIDQQLMKEVTKKFPGSKWADLASFEMIDNKLCGEWRGSSKCPEKEAEAYEKFANEHPQSSKAAEALYNAAWRYAALIQIYKSEEDQKKSDEAKSKALALAQKLVGQAGDSDWGARAQRLIFLVQQDVSTYGNMNE